MSFFMENIRDRFLKLTAIATAPARATMSTLEPILISYNCQILSTHFCHRRLRPALKIPVLSLILILIFQPSSVLHSD